MTNDARDVGPNARRRSLTLRSAPARPRALAALALLGAACGPLLGIDDVEGVSGGGGAGGLAAGQAGAPAQGSAGAGGAPAGTGGAPAGAGGSGAMGGRGGGGGGGPMGPQGFLRFANLCPPMLLEPASAKFDFCIRHKEVGDWQGPILGRLGVGGLAFEQASGYGPLPPGEYESVAVPAAVGTCENAQNQVSVRPLLIEDGRHLTLAVTGPPTAPQLVPFPEGPPPPASETAIGIAHAAPGFVTVLLKDGATAIEMDTHDFSRVPGPPGGWPFVGFEVSGARYTPAPEPAPPGNFYSAFLLPAPPAQEAPIALLLCENNPPPMPGSGGPGDAKCVRLPMVPSPPLPPALPAGAR